MPKVAVILGSAPSVGNDYRAACALIGREPDTVYAVNRAGIFAPRVDVWASLHPENFDKWKWEREGQLIYEPVEFLDLLNGPYQFAGLPEGEHGTSGLACLSAAIQRGEEKIILCGIPMDGAVGHFDNPEHWETGDRCFKYWIIAAQFTPAIVARTRSMSGNTRLLFGEPTKQWLG